jgi:hypothetical protein
MLIVVTEPELCINAHHHAAALRALPLVRNSERKTIEKSAELRRPFAALSLSQSWLISCKRDMEQLNQPSRKVPSICIVKLAVYKPKR